MAENPYGIERVIEAVEDYRRGSSGGLLAAQFGGMVIHRSPGDGRRHVPWLTLIGEVGRQDAIALATCFNEAPRLIAEIRRLQAIIDTNNIDRKEP